MRGKPLAIPVVAATHETERLDAFSRCSGAEPFALVVLGDSMEPEFHEGEVIIVEPDGLIRDGCFVVAWAAGEWYFRQLRRDGDGWFLHPLNPAYPDLPLPSLERVRGVVVMKRHAGRRRSVTYYTPQEASTENS
ncbi:MAG: S24 family peptidase [Hydrogenophilus sp.]